MPLTLQLVNETTLPDGGPVSVNVTGKRGIDIGRAAHLDWCLPDPTRYISSKHCEIRYKDGGYWLHDVSTNGTFLNGADHRMHAPHRLRDGDRFAIGQYIVSATVEEDDSRNNAHVKNPVAPARSDDEDWWTTDEAVPPPIDPKELRPARYESPINPDFLDWAADIPGPYRDLPRDFTPAPITASSPVPPDVDWAIGPPSRLQVPSPPPPPNPAPRRPAPEAEIGASAGVAPTVAATAQAHYLDSARRTSLSSSDFIQVLARSAGIPEDVLAQKDSVELAQQIGNALHLLIENLMQLLNARQQAKRLARTTVHTNIDALDNNPLKFSPSSQDALRILFGTANPSYLDPQRAIGQAFGDLKSHQMKTYSAMQHALNMIMADLDPKRIDREIEGGRISSLLRKAKLWDAFLNRWQAKVSGQGGEPIEAFMRYFAEYYDRDGR